MVKERLRMKNQFKRIYKDLLSEDLCKVTVVPDVYSIKIIFPDVHIEIQKDLFYRTFIKINLPSREPVVSGNNYQLQPPFLTKFTFSVFGRKLYNRAKKIIISKEKERKQEAISKTLEILEK